MKSVHVRYAALALGAAVLVGALPTYAAFAAPTLPSAAVDETPPPKDPEVVPELILGDTLPREEPPAAAFAPLAAGNDSYAHAFTLSGIVDGVSGTLVDATLESKEPTQIVAGSTLYVSRSVWYKWKAPANGVITVDTYGSASSDTTLAIFSGSKLKDAKRLAINDDDGGLGNDGVTPHWRSRIKGFPVKKDKTYRIQVGTQGISSPNTFELNLRGVFTPPSNDALGSAINKGDKSSWSEEKSTFGATIEPIWEPTDNPDDSSYVRAGSQWYKWTPKANGTITVQTDHGVNFDSYLAVFRSDGAGTLSQIGFNDQGLTNNRAKLTAVPVQANFVYYFQVGNVLSVGGWVYPSKVKFSLVLTATGPSISKVSPSKGPQSGGTKITITGERLTGTTSVYVNGTAATGVVVVSSTKVTAFVPLSATKGKKYVSLTAGGANTRLTSKTVFTYK